VKIHLVLLGLMISVAACSDGESDPDDASARDDAFVGNAEDASDTRADASNGADTGAGGVDAMIADAGPRPCWDVENARAGGTVMLGTGEDAFVPMPNEVRVVMGPQGGFHFTVHARIMGLSPGDPDRVDATTPRTRFVGTIEDDGTVVNASLCPIRVTYRSIGADTFELAHSSALVMPNEIAPTTFNRRIRIAVEVLDANGLLARQEQVVLALPPQ
jgi:hypothetical protein